MLGKCFLVIAALCVFPYEAVEGRRLILRPISATTVRHMLKTAGREDAVPEGRVISHGLAAINGFALGLKKGVLGVALADSLAALSLNSSTTGSAAKPSFSYNSTDNQLCFTSRSATSDIVASGEGQGRAYARAGTTPTAPGATPTTPTTPTTPGTTGTTTGATSPTTTTGTGTGTGTGSGTATNTATTTQTTGGTVNCIIIQKS